MDKILQDLEDFVLPDKPVEVERDSESKQKIIDLLYKLNDFCKENEHNSKYDTLDALRKDFTQFFNKESRFTKLNTKKTELILEYQKNRENGNIEQNILLEKLLCKKPSRSISGISSITLVMSPYPNGQSFSCKHDCFYCPNEPAHKGNNWQAQHRR